MIPAEIKKQLEEMADLLAYEVETLSAEAAMKLAEHAWDLAVKYKKEDAYAVQLKWQRSTVHDVCGFLMRVDSEKYEPVCWMIKNYFKITPPQSDDGGGVSTAIDAAMAELIEKIYGPKFCNRCGKVQDVEVYILAGSENINMVGHYQVKLTFTGSKVCRVCKSAIKEGAS